MTKQRVGAWSLLTVVVAAGLPFLAPFRALLAWVVCDPGETFELVQTSFGTEVTHELLCVDAQGHFVVTESFEPRVVVSWLLVIGSAASIAALILGAWILGRRVLSRRA